MSGEYLYQPKNGKIHGILTQLNRSDIWRKTWWWDWYGTPGEGTWWCTTSGFCWVAYLETSQSAMDNDICADDVPTTSIINNIGQNREIHIRTDRYSGVWESHINWWPHFGIKPVRCLPLRCHPLRTKKRHQWVRCDLTVESWDLLDWSSSWNMLKPMGFFLPCVFGAELSYDMSQQFEELLMNMVNFPWKHYQSLLILERMVCLDRWPRLAQDLESWWLGLVMFSIFSFLLDNATPKSVV